MADNEKRLGNMKQMFALFAPEDGGDGSGGAGAGGEGSEKDVVPKSQFLAALNNAEQKRERELAALRAEFEDKLAKATAKPVEQPKVYTRAELNAAVEARQITQEQADAQMDAQARREAEAIAARTATEVVSEAQRKERVDSEINRYAAAAPEILDDDHDTRKRIKEEFKALVDLGDNPRELSTQLKAIRAVLGPLDKLEKSRSGKPAHESHQDTGGGGGNRPARDSNKPLTYETLTPREKEYYDTGLKSGRYKDVAEINAELKFANNRTRAKYGAMA